MDPVIVKALIALLPVIGCLVVFERVDAFKLVSLRDTVGLLAGGAVLATACYFANGGVLDEFPIGVGNYARYVAPILEETAKAALIIGLFAFNRIGYLIDAAIAGFAIGSGFAVAENAFFLHQFTGADMGVWLVRGFGTAVMHGGAGALLSTLSLLLYAPRLRISADRFHFNLMLFLPGLLAAIGIHMAFNHFQNAAVEAMAVVVIGVPLGLLAIFTLGETYAHRWLAEDREAHSRLLDDMRSGVFAASTHGRALQSLADRLDEVHARDLEDYIRTNVELVVKADATLLALEEHERVELDGALRQKLHHLHDLERSLGHALAMAVQAHLSFSRDDLWKLHELEKDASRRDLRA